MICLSIIELVRTWTEDNVYIFSNKSPCVFPPFDDSTLHTLFRSNPQSWYMKGFVNVFKCKSGFLYFILLSRCSKMKRGVLPTVSRREATDLNVKGSMTTTNCRTECICPYKQRRRQQINTENW